MLIPDPQDFIWDTGAGDSEGAKVKVYPQVIEALQSYLPQQGILISASSGPTNGA